MNTIIRLSSTLTNQVAVGLQQTKDYTVKIASNAGGAVPPGSGNQRRGGNAIRAHLVRRDRADL